MLRKVKMHPGEVVWKRGDEVEQLLLVDHGLFSFSTDDSENGFQLNSVTNAVAKTAMESVLSREGEEKEGTMSLNNDSLDDETYDAPRKLSRRCSQVRHMSVVGIPPITKMGTLICEVDNLISGSSHKTTLCSLEHGTVFILSREDVLELFDRFPGLQLALQHTLYVESTTNDDDVDDDGVEI